MERQKNQKNKKEKKEGREKEEKKNPNNPSSKKCRGATPLHFKLRVFEVVKNIPKEKTLSYLEVAKFAGDKKVAWAVGRILSSNFNPSVPCHRVIKSDGSLGGYNRGIKNKFQKLKQEKEKTK